MLLAGCAQLRPLQAPPADEVPAVTVADKRPDRATDLGPVEATSCLNRLWDPRPGWDIALDALKSVAAAKGADALTDVTYGEASVFLCPTALKVSGTALKLPPPGPGEARPAAAFLPLQS